MATVNLNVRVDENLKKKAEILFNEMGLNMSSAINIFLTQAVKTQSIPFPIKRYNSETEKVINETRNGENIYGDFNSVDELWADLNA